MKLTNAVLILMAAAGPGLGESKQSTIDVYINSDDASAQLLGSGTVLASDIFKKIGVPIKWHTGKLEVGRSGFGIRTADHAPETASAGALAASRLSGGSWVEITVYRDRLERFLDDHRSLSGAAAGYVLTHELAHAMQGVARHSEAGILKAQWSTQDYQEMMYHKLAFAPVDVELIHQGLAIRVASGGAAVGSSERR